jgi:integrase
VAITYDVRMWGVRKYVGKKKTTHTVRWTVAGKEFPETFDTKGLAEAYMARLLTVMRTGEAFDTETGLPVSWKRESKHVPTWYEHAVKFAAMKWPRLAPKSRAAIADSLATVTAALVDNETGKPDPKVLRSALATWAFNTNARTARPEPPEKFASAIKWMERHSLRIDKLMNAATARGALDALTKLPDGSDAATTTVNRKRFAFHAALEYAVELEDLPSNPLDGIKWRRPRVVDAVDRRSVVNPAQARKLLAAVEQHGEYGRHLAAFFALLYFAALRPGEALDVRADDIQLPEPVPDKPIEELTDEELKRASTWGEVWLARSNPQPGHAWTDDGGAGKSKALKHRERGEGRAVPLFPELVAILRGHLEEYGTAPDGRIFQGQRGVSPMVSKSTYAKVWREARVAVFGARLAATPLARRPYDLRHACVSTWLNAGVPATQVAEWAGHSVDVLLRIYAKCLDGTQDAARRRIETALGDAVEPGEVRRSDAVPDDEHQPEEPAPTSEDGDAAA